MLFSKKRKREVDLKEILDASQVPGLNAVALKVMRLLRDPDSELGKIADELAWDTGLVVRVLGTVNSAAYAPARPIENVQHALAYLGREQTEHLVLSFAVRDALPTASAPGFDAKRFWRTAAFRAVLARDLAGELHRDTQRESFLAGLLQDLALPILATQRPKTSGEILQRWNDEPESHLHELERESFGWNHGDVGAALGDRWDLPEFLVNAIGHHHDGEAAPPAVHLVSFLRENIVEHGIGELEQAAQEHYGLRSEYVHASVERALERSAEFASTLM